MKKPFKKLKEADDDNIVTINGYNFTGLSYDDNNDIELYVAGGDKHYE